ncbi:YjbF family lipoprotein [Vibrio sp. SA48]
MSSKIKTAKPLVLTLLSLGLMTASGCSTKFSSINDSIKFAAFGVDDVTLTKQQIEQIPYLSSYVTLNDKAQIFMVLAFIDINPVSNAKQYKWLSSDRAMIVTENGRIIKTVNMPSANLDNLLPLKNFPSLTSNDKWQAQYDWQPGYQFGQLATISTRQVTTEYIESVLWQKNTTIWQENVQFNNSGKSMNNTFWVDSDGNVVKSSQWLIPDALKVDMEILKPYKSQ